MGSLIVRECLRIYCFRMISFSNSSSQAPVPITVLSAVQRTSTTCVLKFCVHLRFSPPLPSLSPQPGSMFGGRSTGLLMASPLRSMRNISSVLSSILSSLDRKISILMILSIDLPVLSVHPNPKPPSTLLPAILWHWPCTVTAYEEALWWSPAVGPHLSLKGATHPPRINYIFYTVPGMGCPFHILCKGVPKAFSSQLPPRLLWRPWKFFHLFLAVPVGVKAWGCKPFLLKHILLPLLLCYSTQMLLLIRFIIFIIFHKKHVPQICVSLHSTEM